MNKWFPEIKKNFGFCCMRLPMKDGEVDIDQFSQMVDEFLDAGFNFSIPPTAMSVERVKRH